MDRRKKTGKTHVPPTLNGVSTTPPMKRNLTEPSSDVAHIQRNTREVEGKHGINTSQGFDKDEMFKSQTDSRQDNAQSSGEEEQTDVFESSKPATSPKSKSPQTTSPSRLPVPKGSRVRSASTGLPVPLDTKYASTGDLTSHMSPMLHRAGVHKIKKPEISLPKLWDFKRDITESIKEKPETSQEFKPVKVKTSKVSQLPRPVAAEHVKPADPEYTIDLHSPIMLKKSQLSDVNSRNDNNPSALDAVSDKLKTKFDSLEQKYMEENDNDRLSSVDSSKVAGNRTDSKSESEQDNIRTAIATAELRTVALATNNVDDVLVKSTGASNSKEHSGAYTSTPTRNEHTEKKGCNDQQKEFVVIENIECEDCLIQHVEQANQGSSDKTVLCTSTINDKTSNGVQNIAFNSSQEEVDKMEMKPEDFACVDATHVKSPDDLIDEQEELSNTESKNNVSDLPTSKEDTVEHSYSNFGDEGVNVSEEKGNTVGIDRKEDIKSVSVEKELLKVKDTAYVNEESENTYPTLQENDNKDNADVHGTSNQADTYHTELRIELEDGVGASPIHDDDVKDSSSPDTSNHEHETFRKIDTRQENDYDEENNVDDLGYLIEQSNETETESKSVSEGLGHADVQIRTASVRDEPSVVRRFLPYVVPLGIGIVGALIWLKRR